MLTMPMRRAAFHDRQMTEATGRHGRHGLLDRRLQTGRLHLPRHRIPTLRSSAAAPCSRQNMDDVSLTDDAGERRAIHDGNRTNAPLPSISVQTSARESCALTVATAPFLPRMIRFYNHVFGSLVIPLAARRDSASRSRRQASTITGSFRESDHLYVTGGATAVNLSSTPTGSRHLTRKKLWPT